jgi:RNA-directed DNA polymerase
LTFDAYWAGLDWTRLRKIVLRLQVRIAKAVRERRWGRVKALQWLLGRSWSAKLLAVRRVVTNRGKNTPGVDGVLWTTEEEMLRAARSLKRRGYKPDALRRVYIPKSNGKKRPLGIPTMKDRAMQALHLMGLIPVAETLADPNSYGFRPKRSTADAIGQCFIALATKHSAQWVLDADIKACFDRIDHEWLCRHVPMDEEVLRKWLKAGFVEDEVFHETEAGTPQGGIISPTLANVALDGLEAAAKAAVPRRGAKVNVIRYADDFVVTGASREILETKVIPAVHAFLDARGLHLSPEKTRLVHIEEGFDFLGFNVRKYDGKLLIKPAPKSVQAFLRTIRELVKKHVASPAEVLIRQLNSKLRGWGQYYRGVVAKETFYRIDKAIYGYLHRWMRRRHPGRPMTWIRRRYYRRIGTRSVFHTYVETRDGTRERLDLMSIGDIPIKRHVKVQAGATPYDPRYLDYFRRRWQRLSDRRKADRRHLSLVTAPW